MASTKHHIYQFRNSKDEVIYVGIAKYIHKRIKNGHFSGFGHLPEEAYQEVAYIVYGECVSKEDADIIERYFINTLAPMYNKKHNNGAAFDFKIPEPEWNYLPVDKSNLVKETKSDKVTKVSIPKELNKLSGQQDSQKYVSLKFGKLHRLTPDTAPDYFDYPYVPPFKIREDRDCIWKPKLSFLLHGDKPMVCIQQIECLMNTLDSYSLDKELNIPRLKNFINGYADNVDELLSPNSRDAVERCLNARSTNIRYSVMQGERDSYAYVTTVYSKRDALRVFKSFEPEDGEDKWIDEEIIENACSSKQLLFIDIELALKYTKYWFDTYLKESWGFCYAVKELEKKGVVSVTDKVSGLGTLVSSRLELEEAWQEADPEFEKLNKIWKKVDGILSEVHSSFC